MKSAIETVFSSYAESHSSRLTPLMLELREGTARRYPNPEMMLGVVEALFLQMLVSLSGSKRVLEIGTFTGFSALMMAGALPPEGKLITCELSGEFAGFARRFFEKAGCGGKIELLEGPALTSLKRLVAPFDMFFIDADKENYPQYYEECIRLSRKGSLLVIDNVLWGGTVTDPENNGRDVSAVRLANELVLNDSRVEAVMLPLRDGMTIVRVLQ